MILPNLKSDEEQRYYELGKTDALNGNPYKEPFDESEMEREVLEDEDNMNYEYWLGYFHNLP